MKFREFIAVTRCAVAIQKQVSPHSNLPSSFSWCDWIAEQRHWRHGASGGARFRHETSHGEVLVKGEIQQRMSNTPVAVFGIQDLSPIARPGRFLARSTSHSVAARSGCTNIPLAAAGLRRTKPFWKAAF